MLFYAISNSITMLQKMFVVENVVVMCRNIVITINRRAKAYACLSNHMEDCIVHLWLQKHPMLLENRMKSHHSTQYHKMFAHEAE
jgi:hypothetical protein